MTTFAVVLSGGATAIQFSAVNPSDFLGSAAPVATLSRAGRRSMRALIAVEIAAAFVLFATGALTVRAFYNVLNVAPGFNGDGVLTFSLDPSYGFSRGPAYLDRFYSDLLDQLRSVPGVDSAGAVARFDLPTAGHGFLRNIFVEGAPPLGPD